MATECTGEASIYTDLRDGKMKRTEWLVFHPQEVAHKRSMCALGGERQERSVRRTFIEPKMLNSSDQRQQREVLQTTSIDNTSKQGCQATGEAPTEQIIVFPY